MGASATIVDTPTQKKPDLSITSEMAVMITLEGTATQGMDSESSRSRNGLNRVAGFSSPPK